MSPAAPPRIVFADESSSPTAPERQQIADLVRGILENCTALSEAVLLRRLGASRSGSYVFKATPLDRGRGMDGPPVVVKISALEEGRREIRNYDGFVRPLLPADCRPDLIGFSMTENRAALCFSFLGEGERSDTLTDLLAAGGSARVEQALAILLERLGRSWYSPPRIKAESDLARFYLRRFFGGLTAVAEAEARLVDCATQYFGARRTDHGCLIEATAFPPIRKVLFAGPHPRRYRSCILHGDMNSDNVIVGSRGAAQLVDFPRTGRGHVYQDLVALEASLRINWPSVEGDVLQTERLIATGEKIADPHSYAAAISKIRAAAWRLFGSSESSANYHFAVAAIGLRLMRATDLSNAARARITAATLWAAKCLGEGSL